MAGILQTGTLVDGQWTTTNVDVNTVLELHRERKQEDPQIEIDKTPVFGILSQTVVETPITHWILPARIISNEIHDVAFIGDKFVQLRRLRNDGRLHDIVRKDDFSSRIRNARVVGSVELETGASDSHVQCTQIKDENGDIHMTDRSGIKPCQMPPQYIILALESGDLVFLFAHDVEGIVEFVWCCHKATNKMLIEQPVKHLTVDPSSRYMAMGGSEDIFAVYALHSTEIIGAQYTRGESIQPISSEICLHVDGVIHKMEFLFPSIDDPDHIILLLLVVKNGATGMFVYEWVSGQSLSSIHTNNKRGFKLTATIRLPLLLIPLRIHSAFLLVSESVMAVCKNLLQGIPTFQDVNIPNDAPSSLHFGTSKPLWTAWARPLRTRNYSKVHDDLYIAREDGVVKSLEIDSEEFLQAKLDVGNFRSNIGTAFASLDWTFPGQDNSASDFLVTGGDSGPGGMYLVEARKPAEFVGVIPNWSPAIDFVATSRNRARTRASPDFSYSFKWRHNLDEPDKVFACTGRGSHGAVSEIRYGHEARIRLEVGPLDVPIAETWVLPSGLPISGSIGSELPSPLLFLLTVVGQSLLLHLSADSKVIEEIEQSRTWLDLSSRTLVATAYGGLTVQITERSISISREPVLKDCWDSHLAVYKEDFSKDKVIISAAVFENRLALVVYMDDRGNLELRGLRIINGGPGTDSTSSPTVENLGANSPLSYYPNFISIIKQSDGTIYGILSSAEHIGSSDSKNSPKGGTIAIRDMFRYEGGQGFVGVSSLRDYWPVEPYLLPGTVPEACVNAAYLRRQQMDPGQPELLLVGYRNGLLTMKHFSMTSEGRPRGAKATSQYTMGATPVIIKVDPSVSNVAFICCDSKLWRIEYDGLSYADPRIDRVWFTDPENTKLLQPPVHHISVLPSGLLITNGKQLLVTWFDRQVKPVPRQIILPGPPNRLIYCNHLDVLIVAISLSEIPELIFLNPDTGDEFAHHLDKSGNLVEAPLRVGIIGDIILCLAEWQIKDKATESNVIVVGTSGGDLQLYKFERYNENLDTTADLSMIRSTKYFEGRYDSPIHSIATCRRSLFIGAGRSIWWAELDLSDSTLLTRAEFRLPSRAVSMSVDGEWLNVMTSEHSLMTFLLVDRKKYPQVGEHHGKLLPQFDDEIGRDGLDQILLTNQDQHESSKDSSLIVVTDKSCSVTGLWYRKKAQALAKDHKTIFEADLPASVLKLRLARIRPPWDMAWRGAIPNGVLPMSPNSTELLGIGIDGSIRHFTFLQENTCHLLKFLQDLAMRSNDSSVTSRPYYHSGYRPDPRSRHIDGDILRPFLKGQKLEKLLAVDEAHRGDASNERMLEIFCKLVQNSYGEVASTSLNSTVESCLEETYRQLETLLRPVL